MSQMILWETNYLLSCFLMGILLMAVYDVLRIIRIVLPHPLLLTGAEDIIYWLMVSIAVFITLYRGNDGVIRWYAIASIIIAMLLFRSLISRFLVPFIGHLLRAPVDFVGKVLKNIWKKVRIICKTGKRRWFHGKKKAEKEKEQ